LQQQQQQQMTALAQDQQAKQTQLREEQHKEQLGLQQELHKLQITDLLKALQKAKKPPQPDEQNLKVEQQRQLQQKVQEQHREMQLLVQEHKQQAALLLVEQQKQQQQLAQEQQEQKQLLVQEHSRLRTQLRSDKPRFDGVTVAGGSGNGWVKPDYGYNHNSSMNRHSSSQHSRNPSSTGDVPKASSMASRQTSSAAAARNHRISPPYPNSTPSGGLRSSGVQK